MVTRAPRRRFIVEVEDDDRPGLLAEDPEEPVSPRQPATLRAAELGQRPFQTVVGVMRVGGNRLLDEVAKREEELEVGVYGVRRLVELTMKLTHARAEVAVLPEERLGEEDAPPVEGRWVSRRWSGRAPFSES